MRTRQLVLPWIGLLWVAAGAAAGEWITIPSYYTHDPQSGQRVQQYTPIGPFYVKPREDYRRSGYRHTRSSIQVGASSDNLHIVEEWGRPVRPYGEWRFPYRPNSVPYDLWGPPQAPFGFANPWFRPGHPGPRGPSIIGRNDSPNRRGHGQPYPGYHPQPWHDGRYPPYDSRGPYGYPELR